MSLSFLHKEGPMRPAMPTSQALGGTQGPRKAYSRGTVPQPPASSLTARLPCPGSQETGTPAY